MNAYPMFERCWRGQNDGNTYAITDTIVTWLSPIGMRINAQPVVCVKEPDYMVLQTMKELAERRQSLQSDVAIA